MRKFAAILIAALALAACKKDDNREALIIGEWKHTATYFYSEDGQRYKDALFPKDLTLRADFSAEYEGVKQSWKWVSPYRKIEVYYTDKSNVYHFIFFSIVELDQQHLLLGQNKKEYEFTRK